MRTSGLSQFVVSEHSTMLQAVEVIQSNNSRCSVVVGADGIVKGVFSEGDVLRALLRGSDTHAPISKLVGPRFVYLLREDLTAARKYMESGHTLIPVLDQGHHLIGVYTLTEVFSNT